MVSQSLAVLQELGRGAQLVSLGASIVCAVPATLLDGGRGLLSVAVAAGLVVAYFVSGQLVEGAALQMADRNGMTLMLASYAGRVGLVGLILWWAMSTPLVSGALSSTWVALGSLVALVGWLTGLVIWHSRARIPIYDRPYEAPSGWDT